MSESITDLSAAFWRQVHTVQAKRRARNPGNRPWVNPVESDALTVHPDQVEEAREDAKKCGVPVEFKSDGTPVFTSNRQMRRYARAHGYYHRGYG